MAKIQTLKNNENITVYPQTHTQAVYDANGEKLQNWMNKYLTTDNVGTVQDTTAQAELQTNRVNVVNQNSTNTQYPTAKAVYDAILNNQESSIRIEIAANINNITNPNSSTIYLIGTGSPYQEYLYVNGAWEIIGSNASIDLTNYVTNAALEAKGYVTEPSLESRGYLTEGALTGKNYVTETSLENKNYATIGYVEGYIGDIEAVLATLTTIE